MGCIIICIMVLLSFQQFALCLSPPRRVLFHPAFFLFSCLWTTSCKIYWSDLHENFTRDPVLDKKVTMKFWQPSMSGSLLLWCLYWPVITNKFFNFVFLIFLCIINILSFSFARNADLIFKENTKTFKTHHVTILNFNIPTQYTFIWSYTPQ